MVGPSDGIGHKGLVLTKPLVRCADRSAERHGPSAANLSIFAQGLCVSCSRGDRFTLCSWAYWRGPNPCSCAYNIKVCKISSPKIFFIQPSSNSWRPLPANHNNILIAWVSFCFHKPSSTSIMHSMRSRNRKHQAGQLTKRSDQSNTMSAKCDRVAAARPRVDHDQIARAAGDRKHELQALVRGLNQARSYSITASLGVKNRKRLERLKSPFYSKLNKKREFNPSNTIRFYVF